MIRKFLKSKPIEILFENGEYMVVVNTSYSKLEPLKDLFSHILPWDYDKLKNFQLEPQEVSLGHRTLSFVITKQKIYFTPNSNMYNITRKKLHYHLLKNDFKYTKFNNSHLTWGDKIAVYRRMTEESLLFVPLEDGFYSEETVSLTFTS